MPQRPEDELPAWRCRRCGKRPTSAELQEVVRSHEAYKRLPQEPLKLDVGQAESFLREHLYPRGLLHPTFDMVLKLQYQLVCHKYGSAPGHTLPGKL